MLEKLFRPRRADRVSIQSNRTRRIGHRLPAPRLVAALMAKFLLDFFMRLCRNTTLKPT
jgi:hypothetical protein